MIRKACLSLRLFLAGGALAWRLLFMKVLIGSMVFMLEAKWLLNAQRPSMENKGKSAAIQWPCCRFAVITWRTILLIGFGWASGLKSSPRFSMSIGSEPAPTANSFGRVSGIIFVFWNGFSAALRGRRRRKRRPSVIYQSLIPLI